MLIDWSQIKFYFDTLSRRIKNLGSKLYSRFIFINYSNSKST